MGGRAASRCVWGRVCIVQYSQGARRRQCSVVVHAPAHGGQWGAWIDWEREEGKKDKEGSINIGRLRDAQGEGDVGDLPLVLSSSSARPPLRPVSRLPHLAPPRPRLTLHSWEGALSI